MNRSESKTGAVRRKQISQETRRIIQNAAYALFEEKGYDGTTMRELASRAGVGLGTIFRYFPDKPSLLVAAFEDDVGKVVADALRSVPDAQITEQLLHVTRHLYEFYAISPSLSRNLLVGAYSLSGDAFDKIYAQIDEFGDEIVDLISKAIERDELSKTIDPELAGLAYWSFYCMGRDRGLRSGHFDVDRQLVIVEQLLKQHFHNACEK